jgi:transcriptional regulator with XRE-family HTH domain
VNALSGTVAERVEQPRVGANIRLLRRRQHRTLQQVADASGFSKSLLSKIETGRIFPPVATLVKIAEALGTKVSALLGGDGDGAPVCTPAASAEDGTVRTENGYWIFPFATGRASKRIQPFLFVARRGEVKEHHVSHEGEEFLYVLEGEMKFQVGAVEYTLRAGDSLYFDAREDHGVMPVSDVVRYIDIFA